MQTRHTNKQNKIHTILANINTHDSIKIPIVEDSECKLRDEKIKMKTTHIQRKKKK